ncbi:hypothetical protein [Streptomyces sp. H39-S7]|uniref:hypothetical protein n=1 Tax=Streptomyces sp. H39-S7 TaxID=3004357 RepID=UPI0022AF4EE6|nr:hypothetical protein [Streptomyces sp. H39-S7]MCZ4120816.1 hypothetical protein [Streptomyces sp. H39-S7]
MATFMVLVDGQAGGWGVDREALTVAIRDGWAGVEMDSARRSEARSFCWSFESEDGPGEAYLHEDGTCLYLDSSESDAVRLAVVFRRLTPEGLDLVFCDEGYNFDVRLRSDVSDAELIELMAAD